MRVLSNWGPLVFLAVCLFPGAASSDALASCDAGDGRKVGFEITEGSKINVDISPDGTQIAFDLLGDIYVLPVKGGHAKRITQGLGTDVRPVWSPDGEKIAFISDRDGRDQVFTVNPDGTQGVRQVTSEDDLSGTGRDLGREGVLPSVEWLPSSSEIATRNYIYDINTGTRRMVSEDRAFVATKAGLFGNGDALYYFTPSAVAGEVIGEFGQPNALWRLEEAARGVRLLARVVISGASTPAISRNGRWLVYPDRLPVAGLPISGFSPNDIDTHVEVMRVHDRWSGASRTLLAPWKSPGWRSNGGRLGAAEGNRFAISPDSRYLVISYGGHIHRVDIETGRDEIIPFSAHVQQCLDPTVRNRFQVDDGPLVVNNMRFITMRSDSRQLAFSALRRIYVQDLPGGSPRVLSLQPFGQFDPVYSPDGRWIAYVSWSDTQGGHVWRAPVNGGKPERLTAVAGYYRTPVWSPDGQRVAFAGSHDLAEPRSGFWSSVHGGALHVVSLPDLSMRKLPAEVRLGSPLSFSGDGKRIRYMSYLPPPASRNLNLASIGIDEGGPRDEGFEGLLPQRSDGVVHAIVSPGGNDIAIVKDLNLYVVSCPSRVGAQPAPTAGDCTQTRLTRNGGYDPRWRADGVLEWTLGNTYYQALVAEMADPAKGSNTTGSDPEGRVRLAIRVRLVVPRYVGGGVVALKGARIVTMHGDEIIDKGVILVRDGRIVEIGPSGDVKVPAGAKILEVKGKTIVPGFIDMHAHFTELPELLVGNHWEALIALALGVTTVRDPSNGGDHGFAYAELIETGEMTGPRMFGGTGLLNLSSRSIGSIDDAAGIAERYRRLGATFLKIHSGFDRGQRRWIIEAARRSGLNVVAHVPVKNYGMGRLDLSTLWDGVTTSEHSFSDQSDLFGDVVNFVSSAQTGIVVAPLRGGYNAWGWRRVRDDARVRRFYMGRVPAPAQFDPSVDARDGLPAMLPEAEATARLTVRIARAGGKVMIGSHGDFDGVDMHWEMWGHVHAGMTNHEVLRAATIGGAEGLGVEADLGSLEVGKIADLLILDESPLDDIRNTMSIGKVMKHGVLYEASTLDRIWPEQTPLPGWRMRDAPIDAGDRPVRARH